ESAYNLEAMMNEEMESISQSISDIAEYFGSRPISVSEQHFDVLMWWKSNSVCYPQMSNVARDYLAIPCSSVSVERLFSAARDVVGIRRHSLHADTLRMLMTLKY